jgi:hypothetical protein
MTLSLLQQPAQSVRAGDSLLAAPADWPAPPDPIVYHELIGEIVNTISPHTEADRATRGRTLRVNDAIGGSTDVMLSA